MLNEIFQVLSHDGAFIAQIIILNNGKMKRVSHAGAIFVAVVEPGIFNKTCYRLEKNYQTSFICLLFVYEHDSNYQEYTCRFCLAV